MNKINENEDIEMNVTAEEDDIVLGASPIIEPDVKEEETPVEESEADSVKPESVFTAEEASGEETDTAEDTEVAAEPEQEVRSSRARSEIEASRRNLGNEIGEYYTRGSDVQMPQQEASRDIDALYLAQRNGTVLQANVQRIDAPTESGNCMIYAIYGHNTWIHFLSKDFFAESPRFAEIANDPNPETRGHRWQQAGSSYASANISFVVAKIERDSKTGQYTVYGSRSLAMKKIREEVFFAKKSNVQSGDFGVAQVIGARPNRIVVEFCGVEQKINNAGLAAFEYLPDATKRFKVGDSIVVAVQSIKVDKEAKKVAVALSHSLIEMTRTDMPDITDNIVGSSNVGTVVAVRNDQYIVVFNGRRCRAIINKNNNHSYTELKIGDKVLVRVTRVISRTAHLVIGNCRLC